MNKRICVEISDAFYDSLICAGKNIGCHYKTIQNRCLSNKFPNYQIVPFRITYTEKKCTKCGKPKPLKEFNVGLGCKGNLKSICKSCCSVSFKKYRNANPEKEKKRLKKYLKNNKEKIKKRRKRYRENNPEKSKIYREEHREEAKARKKERRNTDIAFKVNENMGTHIRISLNGLKYGASWEALVDYDLEKLMTHLESKFTEGMSWDNYGYGDNRWNIDHVIAKCHFNITSRECQAFKDCWSLDNLQPLWQVRNFEKGDKPMEPKYLIKPF